METNTELLRSVSAEPVTELPKVLIVVDEQSADQRNDLIIRLADVLADPISADTFDQANGVYKAAVTWLKELEEHRTFLKKPILEIGKSIDEVAKKARADIETARDKLAQAIGTWTKAENARIEKERREIAECERAERERREAEARRIQEELNEKARVQAQMEALPGEAPKSVVEIAGTPLIRAAALPRTTRPEPVKSAVRVTDKKVLEIYDQDAIPFTVNDMRVWLQPDRKQIEIFLKAGIEIPGCRLVEDTSYAPKGR